MFSSRMSMFRKEKITSYESGGGNVPRDLDKIKLKAKFRLRGQSFGTEKILHRRVGGIDISASGKKSKSRKT